MYHGIPGIYLQRRPQVLSVLDVLLKGSQKGLVVSITSVLGLRTTKKYTKQSKRRGKYIYASL